MRISSVELSGRFQLDLNFVAFGGDVFRVQERNDGAELWGKRFYRKTCVGNGF